MRGRPKRGDSGETVAIYLTQEQIGFLRRAAQDEQMSVSALVRRAVNRYFHLPLEATSSSAGRQSA